MASDSDRRRYRRKLTARERDRFVRTLEETGNVTLAAERVGRHRSTFVKLCGREPAFAARCGAAVAEFRLAALEKGRRRAPPPVLAGGAGAGSTKSRRGELILVHGRSRPAQVRRAGGGELTQSGIDRFLATLAATANVRLSAASVGIQPNAIRQRRLRDPAFDEAVRRALGIGYDRLEAALLESACRAFGDDDWAEPGELPPMRVDDALMLLFQHRRTCREGWATKRARHRSASDKEVVQALERRLKTFRPEKFGKPE